MTTHPSPSSPGVARSIGQVLATLKGDFPDISISKIRFLEAEGLLSPQRAPSGYRRYSEADLERLRYVLSVQRDHYLPLKVIKEHLASMDRGTPPPPVRSLAPSGPPTGDGAGERAAEPRPAPAQPKAPLRITRAALLHASGLSGPGRAQL